MFVMDWSQNYTYKLSKCLVEQVRLVLKGSIDGSCFTLRSKGFQKVGAALAKARCPNVSSRHLGDLRNYSSSERRCRDGTDFDISVKFVDQLFCKARFPKFGLTYIRQWVNPRHQTLQGQSVAMPVTFLQNILIVNLDMPSFRIP